MRSALAVFGTYVAFTFATHDACAVPADRWHVDTCATTVSWVELFAHPTAEAAAGAPEQLWVNYGSTPDVMVVGWLTSDTTAASTVQYGTTSGSYSNSVTGSADSYTYGAKYTSGLIHHATLTGLKPSTRYFYVCGSAGSMSAEASFVSSPGIGPNIPHTFGIIADIGENSNANLTVTRLLGAANSINSGLLSGDISYASGCEATGCADWDAFQRMMSPLTQSMPFHISIGNHETYDTYGGVVAISSKYRFAGMPTPTSYKADGVFYYSYNVGPAHVIALSTFYPTEANPDYSASSPMTKWLVADLAALDRSMTPWVIVSTHAPWYNSNTEHQGDAEGMRKAYEQLFIKAGVAIIITGHVHSYERSLPVNDNKVDAVSGITHLNVGDAGADLYTKWLATPAWSAYHKASFGHGQLAIVNSTTALWSWYDHAKAAGAPSDSVTIKNKA